VYQPLTRLNSGLVPLPVVWAWHTVKVEIPRAKEEERRSGLKNKSRKSTVNPSQKSTPNVSPSPSKLDEQKSPNTIYQSPPEPKPSGKWPEPKKMSGRFTPLLENKASLADVLKSTVAVKIRSPSPIYMEKRQYTFLECLHDNIKEEYPGLHLLLQDMRANSTAYKEEMERREMARPRREAGKVFESKSHQLALNFLTGLQKKEKEKTKI